MPATFSSNATGQPGRAARAVWCALLFMLLLAGSREARGQVSREYQLKAVFLFRLAQFVEWPTNRFGSEESPIVIGIAGRNPFGDALHLAVNGETAQGRKIVVRQFESPAAARAAHLLFIADSERHRARDFTRGLSAAGVLTVSDIDNFVPDQGGMVQFTSAGNKVNLRIDNGRAKGAGLVIDGRLLRMADLVQREE